MGRSIISLAIALFAASTFAVAKEETHDGLSRSEETTQDIADARPIGTYTASEFARLVETQVKCDHGMILSSYTPDTGFVLDGKRFGLEEFSSELARKDHEHPAQCVYVAASCQNILLVARLMQKIKGSRIEQVRWRPDPTIFKEKGAQFPQCRKKPL